MNLRGGSLKDQQNKLVRLILLKRKLQINNSIRNVKRTTIITSEYNMKCSIKNFENMDERMIFWKIYSRRRRNIENINHQGNRNLSENYPQKRVPGPILVY